MKLIVIDLDRLKWMDLADRKRLNEEKVCTLTNKDFGKKCLLGVRAGDPAYLRSHLSYEDAIFRLKDDDEALKHENAMFRKLYKRIQYFRVGVILKRDKAVKILSRLLDIS